MDAYNMPSWGQFPPIPLNSQTDRVGKNLIISRKAPNMPFLACSARFKFETAESDSDSRNRMFILGMGYVGQPFANDLKKQGWTVSGTCTSIVKKKKLEEMGLNVYQFDANDPELEVLDSLKYHTHLVVSIPSIVGIGDPLLCHQDLLRSALVDGNLRWLCYLSSTSMLIVYMETVEGHGLMRTVLMHSSHPVNPTSEAAKARLAAEQGWSKFGLHLGLHVHAFRLGGIYGPGRSAIDTIIMQGPLSEGQKMRTRRSYTSRIHVADICQALKASISKPSLGNIYNIVDDNPAPRAEVFAFARDLIEKKWPGQIKQFKSAGQTDQGIANEMPRGEKRVSNARMKSELGVRLLYPDYNSGLLSIIDQMGRSS
ncbi:hypothetical protein RJ641_028959 [Dillenia turbinata]|uniref:NAD-dependent epimerase/dehydratase domain-containing protein n=1 Tax=Dillenia turbinata TaxID=194707 RepID=A0AAN8VQQ7_9MAGN